MCIFKASELNVSNINDLFRFTHNFSLAHFSEAYKSESCKLFVIDSAEKLAELGNLDILQNFISILQNDEWTIIFTTRHCYLDDLNSHIRQTYSLPFKVVNIDYLNEEELNQLSNSYSFTLPNNHNFKDRLRNLFYLKEYLQEYQNIDQSNNLKYFIDSIWAKRIQNRIIQKDNLHIEREKCFIDIAKERCNSGQFYINGDNLSPQALFLLKQDEIIRYDENHNGYFITHDIYEEWAVNKIINRAFSNHIDIKSFFEEIGESLPMRRAFRVWLSEQISENTENIRKFIIEIFSNKEISQFWKDELIVSIILSEHSDSFITHMENDLIADNFFMLDRILFLMRIACTEIEEIKIDSSPNYLSTRPKGRGWETIIELVYKYRDRYFDNHLNLILPILTDWTRVNRQGVATRTAGVLALNLIEKRTTTKNFYIDKDVESTILKIVLNSSQEIKIELKDIFDKVIANHWTNHGDPYQELCVKILKEPYYAIEVIRTLPGSVLQLCNIFWRYKSPQNNQFHRIGMEESCGLSDDYNLKYFPASAFQTPIYFLLQNSFKETLDFIINFTNQSVESYRVSEYGVKNVEEIAINIDDKKIKQYLSFDLWETYRGGNMPDLLQSIHMALEKTLLELAKICDIQPIENILKQILIKSHSASLTAIVCSVVMANPDKFSNTALILFKTIDLFHIDSQRWVYESSILTPFLSDEFYTKERINSKNEKHRNSNLENLLVQYQFCGLKGATEDENKYFIDSIHAIIDQHKLDILATSKGEQRIFSILLARMDRRIMHPIVKEKTDSGYVVELNPQLPADLKEYSVKAVEELQSGWKYTDVKFWSQFKCEGNEKAKQYVKYESNPQAALTEVKEILDKIKNAPAQLQSWDYCIPAFVCSSLIRFYHKELSSEDLNFCQEVVTDSICESFNDYYRYQLGDGVEAAMNSIPHLMTLFHEDTPEYLRILLFVLFDKNPLGANKRFCDYAIETIHNEKFWETSFKDAKSLLKAYIAIIPHYNRYMGMRRGNRSTLRWDTEITQDKIY